MHVAKLPLTPFSFTWNVRELDLKNDEIDYSLLLLNDPTPTMIRDAGASPRPTSPRSKNSPASPNASPPTPRLAIKDAFTTYENTPDPSDKAAAAPRRFPKLPRSRRRRVPCSKCRQKNLDARQAFLTPDQYTAFRAPRRKKRSTGPRKPRNRRGAAP